MPSEHTDPLPLEGVPDIARPVVVAAEEDAAGDGEGDGCDTAKDVVVRERVELTVSTYIEKTARRVIGAGGESVAVGEETSDNSQCGSEVFGNFILT